MEYAAAPTVTLVLSPQFQPVAEQRWLFASADQREAVVLAESFLTFMTSRYDMFETFLERLRPAIQAVQEVAQVAGTERVGLRYVDLIAPEAGQSLADYLRPGLLGLSARELDVDAVLNRFETVAATPFGQLVLRLWQSRDGSVLPPDLQVNEVRVEKRLETGDLGTVLDIDHYGPVEGPFQTEPIEERLWALHEFSDRAFRSAVTKDAMGLWGAVPSTEVTT